MAIVANASSSPARSLRSAAASRTDQRIRSVLLVAIGLQLALAAPSAIALVLDDRVLNGISVWIKPLKFQASLIMLLGTLLWLLPLIGRPASPARRFDGVWLAALVAAVTATGEIAYIVIQAARGRASHFNAATPLEEMAYGIMGIGAALLVLSTFVFGLYLLRRPADGAPQGLRLGGGWGLVLASVLTLVTAFTLSSGQIDGPGHWVGGLKTDLGGLPLMGWSRTGGDLRVPHFFATHLAQALPLLGLLLDRFLPSAVRPGLIAGALVGIAIVVATFVQALMGVPFL